MKTLMKLLTLGLAVVLTACSSNQSTLPRLSESELDQKSYAVAYTVTAEYYRDRVNGLFDTDSFARGANDWLHNKIKLPVEQIEAMTSNSLMEHKDYIYYDGARFAGVFEQRVKALGQHCWDLVQKPSISQGIHDAVVDLKNGKNRSESEYMVKGTEEVLHSCVKTIADDEQQGKTTPKASKSKKAKKAKK